MQGNAAAQAELKRIGIPRVPATVVGSQFVHGWNPEALARLVGIEQVIVPALNPQELAQSLDRILSYAQHGIAAAPDHLMTVERGGRKRSLRDLSYHVFRLTLGFVEAMETGYFPVTPITDYGPTDIRTGPQIAEFGAAVRERFNAWFATAPLEVFRKPVGTYYGEQSIHALFERTAWHAGQHTRQIYLILEEFGVMPPGSLDDSVFDGLPMPEALW